MKTIILNSNAEAIVDELLEDISRSSQLLKHEKESQFARRTFIRTFFSFLDAYGRIIRSDIMDSDLKNKLDSSWHTVLQEMVPEPEKNGTIKFRESRHPFQNLFAATLRAWAISKGMTQDAITKEIFGVNGWNQFQNAILLRHSLTHPKVGKSLKVTTDQTRMCVDAFIWCRDIHQKLSGVSFDQKKWCPLVNT